VVDPTSVRSGEEFPAEWTKYQAKLKKKAKAAVSELNQAVKVSSAAEASAGGSGSSSKKSMKKVAGRKPQSAASKASVPSSSDGAAKSSAAPPTVTRVPVPSSHPSTCQRTEGYSTSTVPVPTSSASGQRSSTTP
jgi:hypothetical protein